MPIYGFAHVFPELFVTGSVAVGIIWLFCSAMAVGIYPLWEGRHSIMRVTEGLSAMKVAFGAIETETKTVNNVQKPAGLPEEKD